VDRPQNRSFLGFSFTGGKSANRRNIAPKAMGRFKARVKELTRRHQGRSLEQVVSALEPYLRGWIGYFGFCQTTSVPRDLDSWIRHRLRCLQWKQWKVYRRRKAELIQRGIRHGLQCQGAMANQPHTGCAYGAQQPILRSDGSNSPKGSTTHLTTSNRHGTDPYAWWCGRGEAARRLPIPIAHRQVEIGL
jgi:RNA-directed DNA polymerase